MSWELDRWMANAKDVEVAARKTLAGINRKDDWQHQQGLSDLRKAVARMGSATYNETPEEFELRTEVQAMRGVFETFFKPVLASMKAKIEDERALVERDTLRKQNQRADNIRRDAMYRIQSAGNYGNPYKPGSVRYATWEIAMVKARSLVADTFTDYSVREG